MCDRTKVEVLARELALEYYNGFRMTEHRHPETERLIIGKETIRDAVERNWSIWEPTAKRILENLGEHKDEL